MKLDLYKKRKADYVAPRKPVLVNIAAANYLAITGQGEPGGADFTAAIGALYSMAFTIKMEQKFAGRDYMVCKLEGLWWGSRKGADFLRKPRERWNWKLMIRTHDFIQEKHRQEALATLAGRGKGLLVKQAKLEELAEGRCVQMLHVGPYSREGETIARMKEYAAAKGLSLRGLHHEIYLSDPRRVAPERLKTILRHPVR